MQTTDPDANVSAVVRGSARRIVAAVNLAELYSKKKICLARLSRLSFLLSLKVLTTLSIRIVGMVILIRFEPLVLVEEECTRCSRHISAQFSICMFIFCAACGIVSVKNVPYVGFEPTTTSSQPFVKGPRSTD